MVKKKQNLVAVFIPAFNEEEKIRQVIESVKSLYDDPTKSGFRIIIIVVDDGSSDRTVEIAKKAGVDKIVSHSRNLGLGAATRAGMTTAYEMGADVAVKLDADLQHDPRDIEKVVRPIFEDKADIVYGSRFAGEIKYKMPLIRLVGNKFFTWLMRKLTGWEITDAQTGLMVYSRKYLSNFNMVGNYNPPQQTLLDAYHRHMRYMEVPVVFHQRTTGKSFVSFKYPFKVFPQMLRTLLLVNPLKVFVTIGVSFLAGGGIVLICEFFLKKYNLIENIHDTTILILTIFGIQSVFFGLLADLIVNKK